MEEVIKKMAQAFSKSALQEIADGAHDRALILMEQEFKPWKRSKEHNDAIDTFRQLSGYCRRVIVMIEEEEEQNGNL